MPMSRGALCGRRETFVDYLYTTTPTTTKKKKSATNVKATSCQPKKVKKLLTTKIDDFVHGPTRAAPSTSQEALRTDATAAENNATIKPLHPMFTKRQKPNDSVKENQPPRREKTAMNRKLTAMEEDTATSSPPTPEKTAMNRKLTAMEENTATSSPPTPEKTITKRKLTAMEEDADFSDLAPLEITTSKPRKKVLVDEDDFSDTAPPRKNTSKQKAKAVAVEDAEDEDDNAHNAFDAALDGLMENGDETDHDGILKAADTDKKVSALTLDLLKSFFRQPGSIDVIWRSSSEHQSHHQ
ncbi:hypothetical protein LTS10_003320 [Elasticomyces elasticus]|nr:hypothetical protein LTS10_003320 [Elasticomyces elasticus]